MSIYAYIRGGLAALPLLTGTAAQAQFAPSWSGFYFGLNAGFARGSSSFSSGDLTRAGFTSPLSITGLDGNGGAVGFGGGLNSQFGFLVLGLEGDWTRTNIRISTPFAANIAPFGAVTGTLGGDIGWIASARLRAGLPAGKALLFGTAGLAVARATGERARRRRAVHLARPRAARGLCVWRRDRIRAYLGVEREGGISPHAAE
jgi:hypothetical protein